jgi:hypothetical protein
MKQLKWCFTECDKNNNVYETVETLWTMLLNRHASCLYVYTCLVHPEWSIVTILFHNIPFHCWNMPHPNMVQKHAKYEKHFLDTLPAEINNSPHRHRYHNLAAMSHHLHGLYRSPDKTSGSHTPPHDLFFPLLPLAVGQRMTVNGNVSSDYRKETAQTGVFNTCMKEI